MEVVEKIRDLLESPIREQGYRLEEIIYEKEGSNFFLRLMIDKDGYITIEDCIAVNEIVGPILDREDPISESYILDVCSKEKGSDNNGNE